MKLDPATGAILGTYATGKGPGGLAFDGTNLWVANREGNSVTKMSKTGTNLGTFAVGKRPLGLAVAANSIFVANNFSNTVTRLSLAGAVLGTSIWIVSNGDSTVLKVDPASGSIITTYATGKGPFAVAYDGLRIWVSNFASNSVSTTAAN